MTKIGWLLLLSCGDKDGGDDTYDSLPPPEDCSSREGDGSAVSTNWKGVHTGPTNCSTYGSVEYPILNSEDSDALDDFLDFMDTVNANSVGFTVALMYDGGDGPLATSVGLQSATSDTNCNNANWSWDLTVLEFMINYMTAAGKDAYVTLALEPNSGGQVRHLMGQEDNPDTGTYSDWWWDPTHADHYNNAESFWLSYIAAAEDVAAAAESGGASLFSLGTETDHLFRSDAPWEACTESAYSTCPNWLADLHSSVAAEFSGSITYDMHADAVLNPDDYATTVDVFDHLSLDIVGVSAWFPVDTVDGPDTASAYKDAWLTIFESSEFDSVRSDYSTLPVLFLEFGYATVVTAPHEPDEGAYQTWGTDHSAGDAAVEDGEETQGNLYQGYLEAREDCGDAVNGMFLWEHRPMEDDDWDTVAQDSTTFSVRAFHDSSGTIHQRTQDIVESGYDPATWDGGAYP